MGRVYRAWHRTLLKHVAVKYLRKSFLRNREAVNQFVREANIVSQLHHPGIVEIHGLGSTPGGGYFIAMDLVDGADLSRFVMSGEIRLTDALQWTIQACKAISHSHECGIIHCDLKPANLVLGKDGRVRVTDFGLARSTSDVTRLWDRIQGTAAYMAPEQISGWWGEITPRTDVYGLGAVLYALLTGRSPHVGSTLTDILSLVVSGVRVVSPIELRGNVPVAINDICLRCLAKSPRDRYDNVRNLIDALDGFDVTQV